MILAGLLPKVLIGAVASAAVFFVGYNVGGAMAASKWKSRVMDEMQNASNVLDRKQGEIEQCRAEVDKINATVSEQGRKLASKLDADNRAREKARKEAAQRDRESAERMERAIAALDEIKIGIENGQFDACVGTDADPEFMRLLNSALSEGSDSAGRDGDMPAPGGED